MYAETSDRTNRIIYEKEFSQFIRKRIENLGGSIKLQHITGHLSQVKQEVRETVGTSTIDILNFIKRHDNIFKVENNVVTLINYRGKVKYYDDDNKDEDYNGHNSLPNRITNGLGVIIKLLPVYGFIKVKEPIKTSVYFSARQFLKSGFDEQVNLTDFGLNIGTMVNFDAIKDTKENASTKYRATKVWISTKVDIENKIIRKPRKDRETGLYDPVNLDGEGIIQNVFPSNGFIAVNGDERNSVFFYKNRVLNYDNIVDLTKVFKRGDLVEFSAHRTTKSDAKARWEATKVWSKSGKNVRVKIKEKDVASISSRSANTSPAFSLSESDSSPPSLIKNINEKGFAREMIHNQSGKISPRSNGTVIKFGENFTQLADGDSSVYYNCGAQVTDISWEFSEGDNVKFDAVKIKSAPGWKAILVWTGNNKPNIVLPTCLGDFSAFSDDEEINDIEDTNSIISDKYLSVSSRSSQKSVSMKSESSDFKSIGSSGKTPLDLQNSQIEMSKNTNKKGNVYKSLKVNSMSPCSSLSNLSSSCESKFSSKSKDKLENKISVCSMSLCSSQNNLSSGESDVSRNSKKKLESEKYTVNETNSVENKLISKLRDISKPNSNRQVVSPSKDDYLDINQDSELKSISQSSSSCIEDDNKTTQLSDEFTDSSEDSETDDNFKNISNAENKDVEITSPASIKIFQGIVCAVTKVYSTFAEVRCSELPHPIAFFGSFFYLNKISMEDLDISDLRQILMVGDTVHVNYFEIVDDSGQFWSKVTLVWKGKKPNSTGVNEMSPEDFILQNALSVTVKDKLNDVQPLEKQKPIKKFLIACDGDDISLDNKDEHEKIITTCDDTSSELKIGARKFLTPCDDINLEDKCDKCSDIDPEDKDDECMSPESCFSEEEEEDHGKMLKALCRLIQRDSFAGLEDKSIRSLRPIEDQDGILRAKTNIIYRQDTEDFRYPVILPSNHPVVHLLIFEEHVEKQHAGVTLLMANLREKFWILKSRKTIRNVINKCVKCQRFNAQKSEQPVITRAIERDKVNRPIVRIDRPPTITRAGRLVKPPKKLNLTALRPLETSGLKVGGCCNWHQSEKHVQRLLADRDEEIQNPN